MDQNQISRLLVTLREECAAIRSRQEELYQLLLSFKDQLQDVKATVVDKLAGLPRSPYIAGTLVPAPDKLQGVDEFRTMLATYLHKHDGDMDDKEAGPTDLVWEKPAEVKPDDIELEEEEPERPRRHGGGREGGGGGGREGGGGGGREGGGGGKRSSRGDNDLQRGPERDVEAFDLNEDEPDDDDDDAEGGGGGGGGGDDAEGGGGRKRRRRRRGGRGRRREGEGASEGGGGAPAAAPPTEPPA